MDAEIVVSAPGRVNLIGEHTDYNLLPVFPIAIQRRIVVRVRPRADRQVLASNADPAFGPRQFELSAEIAPGPPGDWGNYIKAAAQKLVQLYGPLNGMDALYRGDVPPSAGLSSSSALVVASGLALLAANRISIDTAALMPVFADAERYVGTKGGGMDQAISLGARPGCAARIDFEPLRLTHVPVPDGWRFLIAHSLVVADKSGSAREHYNSRPRQSREALAEVVRHLDLPGGSGYRELLGRYPPDELEVLAARYLEPTLAGRFRHIIRESARVDQAVEAMRAGDATRFGALMTASHLSLRDDYEVSCPALDALVEAALEAGALGARLTGAGFGGCTVILTTAPMLPVLIDALEARFYHSRPERARFPDYLLPAEPSAGALVEVCGAAPRRGSETEYGEKT